MSTSAIRDLRGRFFPKREARHIAKQLVPKPQLPAYMDRGEHPHQNCPCWDDKR